MVVVALGIRQAFEDSDSGTLSSTIAIRFVVERSADAVFGNSASLLVLLLRVIL